jgi:hypothetical protein
MFQCLLVKEFPLGNSSFVALRLPCPNDFGRAGIRVTLRLSGFTRLVSLNIVKPPFGQNKCHNFEVTINNKGYIFCNNRVGLINNKDKDKNTLRNEK